MHVPGSAHLGEYLEKMVVHVYKEELVRTVMGVLFRIENIVSILNSDNRRLVKEIVVPSTDMREGKMQPGEGKRVFADWGKWPGIPIFTYTLEV